jgi:hypothetical protein
MEVFILKLLGVVKITLKNFTVGVNQVIKAMPVKSVKITTIWQA